MNTNIKKLNCDLDIAKIEKELKVLLTSEEYERINSNFTWDDTFEQINYYYMDDDRYLEKENITVRIRKKKGIYKLQIKSPVSMEKALHIKTEYEEDVEGVQDIISSDKLLNVCGINIGNLKRIGELSTERKVCNWNDNIEICLDKNTYLGVTDYELEIEYLNEVDKKLLELINELGNSFNNKIKGKCSRFMFSYYKKVY